MTAILKFLSVIVGGIVVMFGIRFLALSNTIFNLRRTFSPIKIETREQARAYGKEILDKYYPRWASNDKYILKEHYNPIEKEWGIWYGLKPPEGMVVLDSEVAEVCINESNGKIVRLWGYK